MAESYCGKMIKRFATILFALANVANADGQDLAPEDGSVELIDET